MLPNNTLPNEEENISYAYLPVKVCTDIKLTPDVVIGEVKTHLCEKRTVKRKQCQRSNETTCKYTVYQMICVEIPIEVTVTAENTGNSQKKES